MTKTARIKDHKCAVIQNFGIVYLLIDQGKVLLLSSIKEKVRKAQLKTIAAANGRRLLLNWQLGNHIINQIQRFGSRITLLLSEDLTKQFLGS